MRGHFANDVGPVGIVLIMKRFLLCGVAALSLAAVAAPALANQYAYVAQNNPWGQTTNDAAMDSAFGAGNWDRLNSYSNAMFGGGYSFIFVDGGDSNGSAFGSWLNGGGSTAAESYVNGGGALFLNAAQNSGVSPIATGFGSQLNYTAYSSNATVNAAGILAGLSAGAGASFTGGYFSHDSVSGGGLTSLIDGDVGVILAEGGFGAGHLTVGGETTTNFHNGGDPFQLRVNELTHAALGGTGGAVPEPASWALMIGGFGMAGAALRRRRAVAVAA